MIPRRYDVLGALSALLGAVLVWVGWRLAQ